MEHPKFVLPTNPNAEYRYKMAMKHVEAARKAGKSSAEIHAMFRNIMNYNTEETTCPTKEVYAAAVKVAEQALAAGKSSEEAHRLFREALLKKA